MKDAAQLREEAGRLSDRAEAILEVARHEARDLSNEEIAEIDSINGTAKQEGKIAKLIADAERLEKIEATASKLREKRSSGIVHRTAEESRPQPIIQAVRSYGRLQAFRKDAIGDDADRQAWLTGHFLMASVGGSQRSAQVCRENGIALQYQGALSEGTDSQGGYLVPEQMERAIINLKEERGVARREARVIPMSSEVYNVPRRTGGVTTYWANEGVAATQSTPTFDNIKLVAKTLVGLVVMSKEVAEDALINLADFVVSELAYGFADTEDGCLFLGDGSSTYAGIVGLKNALAAGSKVTAATGNTAFDTLDLADFHAMTAKLPLYASQNAKWYISKAGFSASMERLMYAGGGNTWETISAGTRTPTFLGYPVVFVQKMNSTLSAQTSTDGLCYFGDLSQAVALGSRRGITIETSREKYILERQVAILADQRFDLVVHEKGTASAAGSVIMLSTPGS